MEHMARCAPSPVPTPAKGKEEGGEWKEIKGFRLYLMDGQNIAHVISCHQVCGDDELAQDLVRIKEAGLIPEEKIRLLIIGDGAPWIWNRCKEIFPSAKEILDYYHCSEYVEKYKRDDQERIKNKKFKQNLRVVK